MHKKLIRRIVESGNTEKMEKLEHLFAEVVDDLDEDKKCELEYELHKIAHGDHISEDLARCWVDAMENKDGSKGGHWSYDQTSQYAGNFDKLDFYVAANMMYSDYFQPAFSSELYLNMARDFLNDKDAGKDKLLKYYFFVAK